jgi:hypothetical protein
VYEASKVIAEYLRELFKSKRQNKLRIYKKKKLIIEMAITNTFISETDSESDLGSFSIIRQK